MEENERSGWWKFHRKIWQNPYMNKPAYLSVWCWLLSEAQWQEGKKVLFRGNKIILGEGQLTCGRFQIAEDTGVPSGTVYRILETLKNEQQIEHQVDNKKSLITIIKWKEYQVDERQDEQQMNNKRTTNEQQMSTTEEVKELKKEKDSTRCSPEARQLSQFFYEKIKQNYEGAKEPDLKKWGIDIDKLINIDKRSPEEIQHVIAWCQNNEFWKVNILSPTKLRKQWDRLAIQIINENKYGRK